MAWVWLGRATAIALVVAVAACGQTTRSRGDGADESTAGKDNRAEECAALANDAATEVTVRIVNGTSSHLYLGQTEVNCVTEPLYRVHDEAGKELGQPSTQCGDCASLTTGGFAGCNADCPQPLAVELAVGEALEARWAGLFSQLVESPPDCGHGKPPVINGKPTCWRSARVGPGRYLFSATAGWSISCGPAGSACPLCLPREGGGCATQQATVPELPLTAKAEVELGTGAELGLAAPVELVFSE